MILNSVEGYGYLEQVCHRLRAMIPRVYDDFSEQHTVNNINVNAGIVTIDTDKTLLQNDVITIVGSGLNYVDHRIASEYVDYCSKLSTPNSYEIVPEFVTVDLGTSGVLHTDIRISIVGSEEMAFNNFKTNPKDSIFIIPTVANGTGSLNFSSNGDVINLIENFKIIIYMYDKNDLGQFENLSKVLSVRDAIIKAFIKFKLNYRGDLNMDASTINFNKGEFVFNTANSTVMSLDFNFKTLFDSHNVGMDWGVNVIFENTTDIGLVDDGEGSGGC